MARLRAHCASGMRHGRRDACRVPAAGEARWIRSTPPIASDAVDHAVGRAVHVTCGFSSTAVAVMVLALAQRLLGAGALDRRPAAFGDVARHRRLRSLPFPRLRIVDVEQELEQIVAHERHGDQPANAELFPGLDTLRYRGRQDPDVPERKHLTGAEIGERLVAETFGETPLPGERGDRFIPQPFAADRDQIAGFVHFRKADPRRAEIAAEQRRRGAFHRLGVAEPAQRIGQLDLEGRRRWARTALVTSSRWVKMPATPPSSSSSGVRCSSSSFPRARRRAARRPSIPRREPVAGLSTCGELRPDRVPDPLPRPRAPAGRARRMAVAEQRGEAFIVEEVSSGPNRPPRRRCSGGNFGGEEQPRSGQVSIGPSGSMPSRSRRSAARARRPAQVGEKGTGGPFQRRDSGSARFTKARKLNSATRDQASAACFSAAIRSSSARLFFSAADLSWPQAAMMSRPRGRRIGALMPASKTMSEKRRIRSSSEHS